MSNRRDVPFYFYIPAGTPMLRMGLFGKGIEWNMFVSTKDVWYTFAELIDPQVSDVPAGKGLGSKYLEFWVSKKLSAGVWARIAVPFCFVKGLSRSEDKPKISWSPTELKREIMRMKREVVRKHYDVSLFTIDGDIEKMMIL